jgi:LuxR family maltose regulon positive regulatory protein
LNLIAADDYIFRINSLMSLGQIEASYSRHDDSIKTFKKAYYLAREKGQLFMEINSLMNLILKLAQAGRLEEALTLNLENIERLKKKDNQSEILIDLLDIPLGILYYYQADYKLAQNKIIRGIEAAEFLDLAHVVWMPKIYYALNSYQLGNKKLADQIIKETLSFTQKHNLKPNHLWAETINLSFELKNEKSNLNLFTAEKIKSYQTLIEQDTFAVLKTKVIFVMTRLFIREQKDREALAHLEKLNKLKIDYIDQITAQILKAVAFFNLNQKNESKKLLLAALLMIKKEKYFTAFIEDYDLLKESLAEFKDLKLALEEKIEFLSEKDSKKSQDHLIEPLTDREIEIIELLAEGYSNKKIAQKLFITEGTTKWHLSNIYSKLAVRNRTKAAAKARKLNII